MSGPPPPLGTSWFPNVGGNIAMNRDPVPPSFDPPLPPEHPPPHYPQQPPPPLPADLPTEQDQHQERILPSTNHHLPALPTAHTFGVFPPISMGIGLGMGFGMGLNMPFGPLLSHIQSAGPLAPPRLPWNTPGLLGNPSTALGACVPGMPALGFPACEGPPVPEGIGEGVLPFGEGVPGWVGGGMGFGFGGIGGMGIGGIGGLGGMGIMNAGFWPGMHRPAPGILTEATGPPQPPQGDITSLPGGVPPGMTLVEADSHSIVHVLKGPVFPWLNHGMPMEVEILYASTSTSINRLIEVCNENRECEGYGISEVHEMVNGTWEKGQTFLYGEPMSLVLTLGDAGWGKERNRPGGRSLHVYFHKL